MSAPNSEPIQAYCDIRCSHSDSLPALLTQLRLSVLLSTYQTGHLVVVSARQGRLTLRFQYAFVGRSKARPTLAGVPIVADRNQLRCGLWVVDLRTGTIAAHLEFCAGVEGIFDVQVLPGIVSPYVSGPATYQDVGQPLWTVPPTPA